MFKLDDRLKEDTLHLADLALCELRLMNNKTLPWLMLVPRREHCIEITDLQWDDQVQLLQEINVSHAILSHYKPDKINTAAIGNLVSQLHIHSVGRYMNDPVWPAPVWGQLANNTYSESEALVQKTKILGALDQARLNAIPDS